MYLDKITPASVTSLHLPPKIEGDDMTDEQQMELFAWFSQVFTDVPMKMDGGRLLYSFMNISLKYEYQYIIVIDVPPRPCC